MIFQKLARNRSKLKLKKILESVIFIFERFGLAKGLILMRTFIRKNWRLKPLTPLPPQIAEIHKNDPYIY